jgi:hypothetical protein
MIKIMTKAFISTTRKPSKARNTIVTIESDVTTRIGDPWELILDWFMA